MFSFYHSLPLIGNLPTEKARINPGFFFQSITLSKYLDYKICFIAFVLAFGNPHASVLEIIVLNVLFVAPGFKPSVQNRLSRNIIAINKSQVLA